MEDLQEVAAWLGDLHINAHYHIVLSKGEAGTARYSSNALPGHPQINPSVIPFLEGKAHGL